MSIKILMPALSPTMTEGILQKWLVKVGDEVMTSEDTQKVTRVQRVEGAPRCEVVFEEGDSIVSSYSHPYFVNSKGFVEVGNLEKGDIIGDLVVDTHDPGGMPAK